MSSNNQYPADGMAVEAGSGNVFADLGLSNVNERLAKAELGRRIAGAIRKRHLAQEAVAKTLGIDKLDVSALVSGRLAGFSLDRLTEFLAILANQGEIATSDRAASHTL